MENSGGTEIEVDVAYANDVAVADAVATLRLSRNNQYVKTISLRRGDQIHVGRQVLDKDKNHIRLQINDPVVSKDQFRIYTVVYEDAEENDEDDDDDDNDDKDDDDDHGFTTSYMFYCEDLATLNGTAVNGTIIGLRAKPGPPFLLTDGDKIFVEPNWHFVFNQMAGSRTIELEKMQREDSLFFKDRYHLSKRSLGVGQFSKVVLANDVATKKQLACKIIDLNVVKRHSRDRERLLDEVSLLRKLNHPNIVTLQKAFRSDQSLFLFLDLAPGGDLMSYVEEHGGILSDVYTLVIVRQVTLAINYLHGQGIVHRDLKPENILVMHNDIGHRVVVSDFGCASVLRCAKRMDSYVGTEHYIAPEIDKEQRNNYTKAVDLWSLGVLTFVLLTGEAMIDFKERCVDQNAVRARLQQPGYDPASTQRWRKVNFLAKDFMARLLVIDPYTRMSAREAIKHDWFTKDKKLAKELEQLYERATKDWKPRPLEEGLLEIIPGTGQDVAEESPPKAKARKARNMNTSPYLGLDTHLRSYDASQKEEVTRTKQKLIDRLKETGETFVRTTDMSTYTPKKTRPNVQFSLASQDITASPHTPRGARQRSHTPRTPTKAPQHCVIRQVDARNMFADFPEEDHTNSPSENPLRESQISTQGEDASQILLSQDYTQESMLLAPDYNESPSLGNAYTRPAAPFSSAPFSTIPSLSIRQKSAESETILPPEPTGSSMEIEELLQQRFSSVATDMSVFINSTETSLTARNEKRKLQVFEDEEDEEEEEEEEEEEKVLVVDSTAPKRRVLERLSTLTQEETDLRKDVLKTMPHFTSAKKYGQRLKEKQGVLSEDEEEELIVGLTATERRVLERLGSLTQEEQDLRKDVLKTLPQFTPAKKYGQRLKEKQGVQSSRK